MEEDTETDAHDAAQGLLDFAQTASGGRLHLRRVLTSETERASGSLAGQPDPGERTALWNLRVCVLLSSTVATFLLALTATKFALSPRRVLRGLFSESSRCKSVAQLKTSAERVLSHGPTKNGYRLLWSLLRC